MYAITQKEEETEVLQEEITEEESGEEIVTEQTDPEEPGENAAAQRGPGRPARALP